MTNHTYIRSASNGTYSADPLPTIAAVLAIAGLSGCANMAAQDMPANCGGKRPAIFSMNVVYENSCPKEVDATDNGCITPSRGAPEKNVVCLCRSEVGTVKMEWQSVEAGASNVPVDKGYELLFDPFLAGPPLKSNPHGKIAALTVIADQAKRPTTNGEPLQFKYTVVDASSNCPLLDPRIIVGN
jgi:hypothetical protein